MLQSPLFQYWFAPLAKRWAGGVSLLLVALLLSMSPTSVSAATSKAGHNDFVISYVANIPKQPVGFGLLMLRPNGWGMYGDVKWGVGVPDDELYENISVNEAENIYGDTLLEQRDSWISINVGAARALFQRKVALYAGAGISLSSHYRRYYDSFEILGKNGRYWIPDETADHTEINFLGGIHWFPTEKLSISLGAEVQPTGITLGLGYRFSRVW